MRSISEKRLRSNLPAQWRDLGINEIYVTVFDKHASLIFLLEKYGFVYVGNNLNGERVYIKDRRNLDFKMPTYHISLSIRFHYRPICYRPCVRTGRKNIGLVRLSLFSQFVLQHNK